MLDSAVHAVSWVISPCPFWSAYTADPGRAKLQPINAPAKLSGADWMLVTLQLMGQPPGRAHAVQAVVDSPGFIRGERGRDDVPLSAAGMFGLNTRSRAAGRGRRSLHALGWV